VEVVVHVVGVATVEVFVVDLVPLLWLLLTLVVVLSDVVVVIVNVLQVEVAVLALAVVVHIIGLATVDVCITLFVMMWLLLTFMLL
jgi:hypothetical protein